MQQSNSFNVEVPSLTAESRAENPQVVSVKGRDYSVYFHHATGEPCTVLVHKMHHQTARIGINGPTARAAIAKAQA